jgi:hypothetical protein
MQIAMCGGGNLQSILEDDQILKVDPRASGILERLTLYDNAQRMLTSRKTEVAP